MWVGSALPAHPPAQVLDQRVLVVPGHSSNLWTSENYLSLVLEGLSRWDSIFYFNPRLHGADAGRHSYKLHRCIVVNLNTFRHSLRAIVYRKLQQNYDSTFAWVYAQYSKSSFGKTNNVIATSRMQKSSHFDVPNSYTVTENSNTCILSIYWCKQFEV